MVKRYAPITLHEDEAHVAFDGFSKVVLTIRRFPLSVWYVGLVRAFPKNTGTPERKNSCGGENLKNLNCSK